MHTGKCNCAFNKTVVINYRKWIVAHESPKFVDSSTQYIGLTIPMKWIPRCVHKSSGASIGTHTMSEQLKTFIHGCIIVWYCLVFKIRVL